MGGSGFGHKLTFFLELRCYFGYIICKKTLWSRTVPSKVEFNTKVVKTGYDLETTTVRESPSEHSHLQEQQLTTATTTTTTTEQQEVTPPPVPSLRASACFHWLVFIQTRGERKLQVNMNM